MDRLQVHAELRTRVGLVKEFQSEPCPVHQGQSVRGLWVEPGELQYVHPRLHLDGCLSVESFLLGPFPETEGETRFTWVRKKVVVGPSNTQRHLSGTPVLGPQDPGSEPG